MDSDLEISGSGLGDDEDYDEPSVRVAPLPGVHSNNDHTDRMPHLEEEIHKTIVPNVETPYKKDDDIFINKEKDYSDHLDDKHILLTKSESGPISFFAQPGILAAIVGGALVGLLCAILVVMFIVYRMRKKDEGSYAVDERKRSSTPILYGKNDSKELYA